MPEVKYSKAMKRLEEIVAKIESEEIDVDELSAQVKEAVTLIKTCKDKIEKAELDIKKVVDNLDAAAQ
ncbi:MAG: exodeoxyribonuclease VII small subunit [Candidatus Omnitrophica bacterium]|nr:exodeoxyribonuclease VII small subunit [Candidatus Omnitrophota bacterium]